MGDRLSKFGEKAKELFDDFTEDLKESTGEAKVFLKEFKDEFVSMTEDAVEFVEKKIDQVKEEQTYDYTVDMANDPDKHIHETNRDK